MPRRDQFDAKWLIPLLSKVEPTWPFSVGRRGQVRTVWSTRLVLVVSHPLEPAYIAGVGFASIAH